MLPVVEFQILPAFLPIKKLIGMVSRLVFFNIAEFDDISAESIIIPADSRWNSAEFQTYSAVFTFYSVNVTIKNQNYPDPARRGDFGSNHRSFACPHPKVQSQIPVSFL